MLTSCFLHLPGIGKTWQARLHEAGIDNWAKAAEACRECSLPLPVKQRGLFASALAESEERLAAGDARWFSERLKGAEAWRLYPHFSHSAAYVDIETTGLGGPSDHITSIALYDGESVRCYVYGRNLEDFARDIRPYSLLVTWNGRCFDVPFIRRALSAPMEMAHLDLLPVFRAIGLKGGLKAVESKLGLTRQGLNGAEGVDGWTAVLLWQEFRRSGDERALETLLAYNVEDVLSLEYLSRYACAFHAGGPLPDPRARLDGTDGSLSNPYRADADILGRVQSRRRF